MLLKYLTFIICYLCIQPIFCQRSIPPRPEKLTDPDWIKEESTLKTKADSFIIQLQNDQQLINDTSVINYLLSIVEKMYPNYSDEGNLYILRSADINAWTIGNGDFIVHCGLIQAARNEAQLAAVMAHELAHYQLRHVLKSSVFDKALLNKKNVTSKDKKKISQYSISNETEADSVGMILLKKAGYDVNQAVLMFKELPADTNTPPTWVSALMRWDQFLFPSHPKNKDRIAALQRQSSNSNSGTINADIYLKYTQNIWDDFIKEYKKQDPYLLALGLENVKSKMGDTTLNYFDDLLYEIGAVYQELYCNPDLAGQSIRKATKKAQYSIHIGFDVEGKKNLNTYNEVKDFLLNKAITFLTRVQNKPKYIDRVKKNFGLLAWAQKDKKKALILLNEYVNSPEAFKDKRYIKSIINEINSNKK